MSFPDQVQKVTTEDSIISVMCNEPEGNVLRTVRQLIFTPENLHKLWENVSKFPTLYGIDIGKNPEVLAEHIKSGALFFVVDDFIGLFTLDEIRPEESASVHYSFFDRRHRGRADLIKCMLVWAFETFKFKRLNTQVPVYVQPNVLKFVTDDLGFVYEGKQRLAASYNDKRWHVNMYGLLREDLINGEPQS